MSAIAPVAPEKEFDVHVIEPVEVRLREIISAHTSWEYANSELERLTGIRHFLSSAEDWQQAKEFLLLSRANAATADAREFGDFQTPLDFTQRICRYLSKRGLTPDIVIEPACGIGHFLTAALENFSSLSQLYAVEIQSKYLWQFKLEHLMRCLKNPVPNRPRIDLLQDDIFSHQFSPSLREGGELLILGNPPWVTNARLGETEAVNHPLKSNVKSLAGLDALTGKSNFDINEWIVLRLLQEFSGCNGFLALLCKNSVIKNLVQAMPRASWHATGLEALQINAGREFGVATSASLLVLRLGGETAPDQARSTLARCRVADFEEPKKTLRVFGWVENRFVADVENYNAHRDLDGVCSFIWRQGIKHDCSAVMELKPDANGGWLNGFGKKVEVENERVYGLIKSSDLKKFEVQPLARRVLLPQSNLNEDTAHLEKSAPRLWKYLYCHAELLHARKSRIYKGKPDFSIFGVGAYSFKPYKVAVSGLYKKPRFCLLAPHEGQPVLLDDTCYFLGFDTYRDALFSNAVLNSEIIQNLLGSLTFSDAMRPFTKEVLMRLDLMKAARQLSFGEISEVWTKENYEPHEEVTPGHFQDFIACFDPPRLPFD